MILYFLRGFMITKLQLVALGLVVSQGADLVAMEHKASNSLQNSLSCSAEARKAVKHQVEMNKVAEGAKRQCVHLSMPKCFEGEGRDWAAELKKNPRLAWLPI
jgi:hypothetical protein